jgi:hypothetical protein
MGYISLTDMNPLWIIGARPVEIDSLPEIGALAMARAYIPAFPREIWVAIRTFKLNV